MMGLFPLNNFRNHLGTSPDALVALFHHDGHVLIEHMSEGWSNLEMTDSTELRSNQFNESDESGWTESESQH